MTRSFAALLVLAPAVSAAAENPRPNIVFMLADDQSWDGTSVVMHPNYRPSRSDVIETPRLEELAREGMRFSAAYAPAPMCSPTRCSLQLGMNPAATGWTRPGRSKTTADNYPLVPPRSERELDPRAVTFAELLKKAGYATAHFGKWHLGGGGPGRHGYDAHDGDVGNEAADRYAAPNPVDVVGMSRRATEFMRANRDAGRPFFIQLSWLALHGARNATPARVEKYRRLGVRRPERAAIAEDLDAGVGLVVDAVDRLGLGADTFVIYYSDNGGSGGALRGGKGDLYEGGIRSPLIVRGPGVAAWSWCHEPTGGTDFFPTFCDWAGVPARSLPDGLEGGSLADLLSGGGRGLIERSRDGLLVHFPHYQGRGTPQSALILGGMKIVKSYEDRRVELFDIENDIGERRDLAASRPAEAAVLEALLDTYLAEDGAALPTTNPSYDATKPRAETRRGGRRGRATGDGPLRRTRGGLRTGRHGRRYDFAGVPARDAVSLFTKTVDNMRRAVRIFNLTCQFQFTALPGATSEAVSL